MDPWVGEILAQDAVFDVVEGQGPSRRLYERTAPWPLQLEHTKCLVDVADGLRFTAPRDQVDGVGVVDVDPESNSFGFLESVQLRRLELAQVFRELRIVSERRIVHEPIRDVRSQQSVEYRMVERRRDGLCDVGGRLSWRRLGTLCHQRGWNESDRAQCQNCCSELSHCAPGISRLGNSPLVVGTGCKDRAE